MSERSSGGPVSSSVAADKPSGDVPERAGEHPLGPLVSLSEDRSNLTRLTACGVLLGAAVILGMAWTMAPNAQGMGTHLQLGLRPCGFLITTGLPCPTCGMTTAFAHTVRGRFGQAVWSQPAGTVLAMLTAVLGGVAIVVMITGRRLELNWYRVSPMRVLIAALVLFLGGWVFKIVVVLLARGTLAGGA